LIRALGDDSGREIQKSLKGRVNTDEVDLVTQLVQVVEEGYQLSRSRTIEETHFAQVDADTAMIACRYGAGFSGEGRSPIFIQIAFHG
jgi:hypothetical protein